MVAVKAKPQQFSRNAVRRSVCRESYSDYVKTFWHTVVSEELVWNWHMEVMCNRFQDVMERVFKGEDKLGDEVINISPGTSKSLLHTILPIGWCWSRMPSLKGIFGSYSYELSLDLAGFARDVIWSDLYQETFPEIQLRSDQTAKGRFTNTRGGWRFACATRGNVTGRHAHLIVIDDPLNPKEAWSAVEGQAANRWLQHTLPSRKVNKRVTPTFLVMQRLAESDPTDLFLRRPGCRHLCLPAELTEDVYPRRYRKNYVKGKMDSERLGKKVLEEAKEDLGKYAYAGQFLQNPVPPEGGMFDTSKIKIINPLPDSEFEKEVRGWDKGGTEDAGTYTAGVRIGRTWEDRIVVRHVVKGQWDSGRREYHIEKVANADGHKIYIALEQEGGSGGKESAENTVRRLMGFKVRVHKVGKGLGDKVKWADPFSTQVNNGNVYLERGPWNEDYLEELKHFPNGKFVDQVDATSRAFATLTRKRGKRGGIDQLLANAVG